MLSDKPCSESSSLPAASCTVRTVAAVPAMAVSYDCKQEHRLRVPEVALPYPLAVARKVKRAEVLRVPAAQLAMEKEWNKLANAPHPDGQGKGVWDISSVREAADVRKEAINKGEDVHLGRIAELCFQKGSELSDDDPKKKYKGRHVFLGSDVKDQNFEWAVFEKLSSAPANFEAARTVDALGLMAGYERTKSDVISAYTQEFFGGA